MKYLSYIVSRHNSIYKYMLFVLSTVLILLSFPKGGKFKYEIRKFEAWSHDELFAPFTFPISKTQEELEAEKKDIEKNSNIYYVENTAIVEERYKGFTDGLNKAWELNYSDVDPDNVLRQIHFNIGKEILDTIFSKGIVEKVSEIKDKTKDLSIVVINSKTNDGYTIKHNKLYTLKTASQYISVTLDEIHKSFLEENKEFKKDLLSRFLQSSIESSILFDKRRTEKEKIESVENIIKTKGVVKKGELIIAKGIIVDEDRYKKLISLKNEYEGERGNRSLFLFVVGQYIIISLVFLLIFLFFYFFRKDIWNDNKRITFISLAIISIVAISSIEFESFSIYVIPFSILPIIIRTFFDSRLAIFIHIVTILLVAYLVPNSYEFAVVQIVVGAISVFSIVNMRKRASLFYTSLIIYFAYVLIYFGLSVIQENNISDVETGFLAWFAWSSLLTLLVYPLIFILEKAFGFVSEVTLLEISDSNSPLLRRLAEQAPGTFQHSLQVANLAESAVFAVGGNSLLIRCGALYHDIGKSLIPRYFTENQTTDFNPHDELSTEESADLIISHVIKGIELAKENNIPDQVIDFIRTHHGTTVTRYFYEIFKKDNPDQEINKSMFTYWGPEPFSKETAILMMADSVEAASRSLKKHDYESINNVVENVINRQIKDHQFDYSDITFKEISVIKKLFKKKLINIYHARIEYPKFTN